MDRLNTRPGRLKQCQVSEKYDEDHKKSTPLGAFLRNADNLVLLLQFLFSEQIGKQGGTQITLTRRGKNNHNRFIGKALFLL